MQPTSIRGVTLRSVLIGLALIPINAYWIMYTEMVWWGLFPTTMSLFFNAIFFLFTLTLLNLLLQHLKPDAALTHGELLVIYIILCLASTIASHDHAQVLIPMIGHTFWFETPENEWRELLHRYIPTWATVQDKTILEGFYEGQTTLYEAETLKAWLGPTLWWTSFIMALLFVMLCINVILRKQWTEREKLAYPIIQLPLEMTRNSGATFFRSRPFWIAFILVSLLNIVNGLSYLFPTIPVIGVRLRNISHLFTEKPWSAIGWTPFSIYPFVIGLGFFMPLDLSFSCWFFYLFRKMQAVAGETIGIRGLPGFPYDRQQSLGAYLGLAIFALWASRKYLAEVFKQITRGRSTLDESVEPMRYRTALIGLLLGSIYLIAFSVKIGISITLGIAFFVIYFALSTGITRMRVESGAPAHDLHFMGPDYALPALLGSRGMGGANLTALSFLFFFNRAHRSHPMPHQLEAFQLAARARFNPKPLIIVILLAVLIGSISSFWAYLHDVYRFGSTGSFAHHPFNSIQKQLNFPTGPNVPEVTAMSIGMGFTFLLMFLRMRFFWWPFHAVGYAVSGAADWCMNWLWISLVISSTAKWLIIKQGGLQLHRKAAPFFLGLILGEFIAGSLWSFFGMATETRIFPFKDW